MVREVKTPKSRRMLALTPEMVAMFRQHRVRQAEAQMAAEALWQDRAASNFDPLDAKLLASAAAGTTLAAGSWCLRSVMRAIVRRCCLRTWAGSGSQDSGPYGGDVGMLGVAVRPGGDVTVQEIDE